MTARRVAAGFVLVGFLCAMGGPTAGPAVRAQVGSQAPVFKGRLDVVRTEVAVIDNKTGKPVTGLTERDFTVSENGVRQTIASFVDESRASADEAAGAAVPPATDARRRVFLFVFSVGLWDGPYKVYDGAAQFIRERLEPQDLVGILAWTRLSPLTTDHERIAAIVDRLKSPPKAFTDAMAEARFRERREGVDISPETEHIIDRWLDPQGAESAYFRNAAGLLIGTPEYRWNDEADIIRDWTRRLGINDVLKASAGIEYLRRVPGEKHVVLFSVFGFNPPVRFANEGIGLHFYSTEDDRRFAARANNAGVALDIIQTSGTGIGGAFAIMSNQTVADESGGQFSSVRVAAQQLARLDDATRSGYILGYVPSNPELDGKYRNVKVAVSRKDVTIVYRRGYTATADPGPVDAREVYRRTRMRDAAVGNTDLGDIKVRAQASRVEGAGTSRGVRVDLNFDISSLPLQSVGGKWTGAIDLLILCGDAKQEVVGKIDQHMTLGMSQETWEQAHIGGVPYSTTVPVTGQTAVVKVVVYHFDSDRLGTASVRIR
jgi:VWFA-related protein